MIDYPSGEPIVCAFGDTPMFRLLPYMAALMYPLGKDRLNTEAPRAPRAPIA